MEPPERVGARCLPLPTGTAGYVMGTWGSLKCRFAWV